MDWLHRAQSFIRVFLLSVFTVFFLSACDGADSGGSDDSSDSGQVTTPTIPTTSSPYSVSVRMVDADGSVATSVGVATPGTVTATLLNGGEPVASELVLFSLSSNIAELLPVAGTALTNAAGVASIVLQAGSDEGAGTITATAVNVNASNKLSFAVSASTVEAAMVAPSVTPLVISSSGTAVVEVLINQVVDGVASPISETVKVQFDSECVQVGDASIDAEVSTVGGVARATYEDNGCGKTDTIGVTAIVGSQLLSGLVTLDVQKAGIGSIEFVSAEPNVLFIVGSGGPEISKVKFLVKDEIGNVSRDTLVGFKLHTTAGGVSLLHAEAQTNSQGEVTAFVRTGTVGGVVSIEASVIDSPNVAPTLSRDLVILRGVPTRETFSIAVDNFNPEALIVDGAEVEVTAYLGNHFRSGVPDGTVVGFRTEFGVIVGNADGGEGCSTVNSKCSVIWRSQGSRSPLPFRDTSAITRKLGDRISECRDDSDALTDLNNDVTSGFVPCIYNGFHPATAARSSFFSGLGQVYGNRVSIMGFVAGEESFSDSNGDGLFNANEAFEDISEPFLDENEDSVYGNKLGNGQPSTNASTSAVNENECYDGSGNICFQPGGDNEEFVDNTGMANQQFDLKDGQYNGSLCAVEGDGCTKELGLIWRDTVILQSGSNAVIGLIEEGLNPGVKSNYFQDVDLSGDGKVIVAYVADRHNGRMPNGTTITLSGNGDIQGSNTCTVVNSPLVGITSCSFALKRARAALDQDDSHAVLTVTSPGGVETTARIMVREL